MKKSKILLLTLFSGALILNGCSTKEQQTSSENSTTSTSTSSSSNSEQKNSNSQSQTAFDFTAKDVNGKDVKLSDFKGKKVYINVWASWCGPCKIEMPGLEKVYQKHKDEKDFVFLSITSPSGEEFKNTKPADQDKETILGVAEQKKITYPILFDVNDRFMINYSIRAFPTHIFVNSDGTLMEQFPGIMDESTLENKLKNLK